MTPTGSCSPALAAGTPGWKAAKSTSWSTVRLALIGASEVGFPPGVFNVVLVPVRPPGAR